jgi:hypothetical protein
MAQRYAWGQKGVTRRPVTEIDREFSIRPQRKLLRKSVSNCAFIAPPPDYRIKPISLIGLMGL